ncbi:MAG TPA: selenium metabolism-associated LysR family transcriptional regulator [Thermodesulfobacteriota bacterium]|nr:selenium metabolism-associated LysR family transcriptional regulator [Thermodesulfobacteriota bacterium]
MDLRQLEVLCKIVELKSFSRAAEAIFLTQPTVSGHIKTLEEEVGTRLLDRLDKEVVPTRAGLILYRYARKILELRQEARQALDQFLGTLQGELVIGGSTIPGEYVLPELISRFKARSPQVTFSVRIGDTRRILRAVGEGELELAVVGGRLPESRVELRPFLHDEIVLVVPPHHEWARRKEIAAGDLKGAAFVWRERGSGTREAVERALAAAGLVVAQLPVAAELGSTEAVRQGVRVGLGPAFLSRRAVVEDLEAGRLAEVKVRDLRVSREFFIATQRGRSRSPVAQAFFEFLIEQVPPQSSAA